MSVPPLCLINIATRGKFTQQRKVITGVENLQPGIRYVGTETVSSESTSQLRRSLSRATPSVPTDTESLVDPDSVLLIFFEPFSNLS